MTNRIQRIYLDMDGVVADLAGAVFKRYGLTMEEAYNNWTPGVFEMSPALGYSDKYFWSVEMASVGEEFWANIEEYPWAKELYEFSASMAETHFLSTPSDDPHSAAGKIKWLQKFTNDKHFKKYTLTNFKEESARWNRILIDDKEANIDAFSKAGGKTILFPRRWNRLKEMAEDPMKYVKSCLLSISNEIRAATYE